MQREVKTSMKTRGGVFPRLFGRMTSVSAGTGTCTSQVDFSVQHCEYDGRGYSEAPAQRPAARRQSWHAFSTRTLTKRTPARETQHKNEECRNDEDREDARSVTAVPIDGSQQRRLMWLRPKRILQSFRLKKVDHKVAARRALALEFYVSSSFRRFMDERDMDDSMSHSRRSIMDDLSMEDYEDPYGEYLIRQASIRQELRVEDIEIDILTPLPSMARNRSTRSILKQQRQMQKHHHSQRNLEASRPFLEGRASSCINLSPHGEPPTSDETAPAAATRRPKTSLTSICFETGYPALESPLPTSQKQKNNKRVPRDISVTPINCSPRTPRSMRHESAARLRTPLRSNSESCKSPSAGLHKQMPCEIILSPTKSIRTTSAAPKSPDRRDHLLKVSSSPVLSIRKPYSALSCLIREYEDIVNPFDSERELNVSKVAKKTAVVLMPPNTYAPSEDDAAFIDLVDAEESKMFVTTEECVQEPETTPVKEKPKQEPETVPEPDEKMYSMHTTTLSLLTAIRMDPGPRIPKQEFPAFAKSPFDPESFTTARVEV